MLGRVVATASRAAFAPLTLSNAAVNASVRRPVAPFNLTSVTDAFAHLRVVEEPLSSNSIAMELLNRNARRPKKANHGKRPCSNFARRQKRLSRRNKN
ncbi:hypothetical protein Poli38472_004113 [Pythium oligandrum]|uniref:Uncharacterized protein n=1 Tax=Pythium oligandrum TaxID=41045 RepID=A0A8K1CNW6_PYTOL|nr:hypothetical protein Poli38472_004113 [Pythium oligandrum]|eukprot:TMW66348.1 hypothetical protein Poli38472_004113 [Pythium oligandrum]